ncbi:hypothetical protein [Mesorhizobium sanjuanii]|nr:hypothetical protein [Mesorhizobium sanjuanii]
MTGIGLMAIGACWLAIVAIANAMVGNEATMMKYGFHPPAGRNLEFFKKFRPVYMAVMRGIFRPGGWVLVAIGACMVIVGLFERFGGTGA